LSADSLLV